MSGSCAVMDPCFLLTLKLMLLTVALPLSTASSCGQKDPAAGVDYSLSCVNDYLLTINCSLHIAPAEDEADSSSRSYWLDIIEQTDQLTLTCRLTHTNENYFCSVNKSVLTDEIFSDTETYDILLCHSQNNDSQTCKCLDDGYAPEKNIKPNPPCCFTVTHNASQYHFAWKSTYEEYVDYTAMMDELSYELHYYTRGDKHNGRPRAIITNTMCFSVDDDAFEPDTEYAARVRSSPNQGHYKGQWSDWSSEVHWKMGSAVSDPSSKTMTSMLDKVFIPLCVVALLVILLVIAPLKKWKQRSFIPTPAPYFHTLYSDCQGDFKSWVVTQNKTPDILQAEETLQIDKLTEREVAQEKKEEDCQPQCHQEFTEGSTYSNIPDPESDTSLLGLPYAVSTMDPPPAPGSSLKSLNLSSETGSPIEFDSGCWLWSDTSLDRDPPFYCNEYCTLSTFQQTNPQDVLHHGGP
ncbi:uncharacterized protein V6R79_017144 [Siganus canaliculatus]